MNDLFRYRKDLTATQATDIEIQFRFPFGGILFAATRTSEG
jgi:hypothetical protein